MQKVLPRLMTTNNSQGYDAPVTRAYSVRHKLVSVSDSSFCPRHARLSKGMEFIAGGGKMSLSGRRRTGISESHRLPRVERLANLSFSRKADSRGSINCNRTDRSVP
jgi:hypothetical protein